MRGRRVSCRGRRSEPRRRPIALAIGAWMAGVTASAVGQTLPDAVQTVEVIGTAPLPGQAVDRGLLPYATQLFRRDDLDRTGAAGTSSLLGRVAAGVTVTDVQGSPFQPELNLRGYRASGLLGAAQGVSVYLDGVRVNEAFGDIVSWDLLPDFALETVALVPGANPAFGLNTLGGAIALTTVSGGSAPGWQGELQAGSFGRRQVDLGYGRADEDRSHYLGIGLFEDDGWRDHSPGRRAVLLGKTQWHGGVGDLALSLLAGRSVLVGNGLVPWATRLDGGEREPALGQLDRQAVYTHPDRTDNRALQVSLLGSHELAGGVRLEALLWGRRSHRLTLNGDEAEDDDEDGDATADTEGRVVLDRRGPSEDDGDDDDAEAEASLNRSDTRQTAAGLSLGASGHHGAHRWQAGLSLETARVRYAQTEQAGRFDTGRGVHAVEGEPATLSAAVRGRTRHAGLYAGDTWQLAPGTHLTAGLRWNHTRVGNTLTRVDDDTGEAEDQPHESFTYRTTNPALGLAQRVGAVTLFANVARNTRVPTVIELGCADPEQPCRLPAGLQADPYLKPVRTRSVELGGRFGGARGHGGSLTWYRLDNRDDILFASVSVTGQLGYFRNFPDTRRQGVDAEWRWRGEALQLGLSYSLLDATYEAAGVLRVGERNVDVTPGTRIAGLPRHTLKAQAQWMPAPDWQLGADWQWQSRRTSAGNEDGRLADGGPRSADLSVPGYALLNLRASWQVRPGLTGFIRVDNVTDRRAASFGALAETQFDAQGAPADEPAPALFAAPIEPRSITVGLRWTL